VAIHDDVRRSADHDHDGALLTGLGQRGQQPPFACGLLHAQAFVPQLELMKFQVHEAVRSPALTVA
jgi:hypothetical protein